MKKFLFNTSNTWSPFFLRIILGLVFFAHGAQKLMGWFGGYGFKGTMAYFTDTVCLPWIIGFTVIIIECFGSLALILGLATRVWSLAFIFLNIGIIATVHYQHFFMNWFGNQKIEGYEYFLLAISMALSLVFTGAGRLSLDQKLSLQPAATGSTN
ncbi:DoxX family protein [Flavisolibacter tropicus]|uniref:DoxX n=1 Tax=Flavisolibacter tropicus TaxID=1492898 RepID=A0A172TXQ5_9BACT|nr:DoxX family protein [Flavisolibacter tropicus]ANE51891.1 DoxX [Flavisolibacter tropicus]